MTDFSVHKLDLAIHTLTEALKVIKSEESEYYRLGYTHTAISLALSDLNFISTQLKQ